MRTARILGVGTSYYHVMSRVVDRRFIFGDLEKEIFRELMRKQARFAGIEILTYSCMSNHFHILLRVPRACEIDNRELQRRLKGIYPAKKVRELMNEIDERARTCDSIGAEELRKCHLARMHDLAAFMKELKQRFYTW